MPSQEQEPEEWRPIPGFGDRYEVSDHGRVRSKRFAIDLANGGTRIYPPRILSGSTRRLAYRYVCICFGGREYPLAIHRLVAAAFCHQPDDATEVNHIDLNKANNHASNLEWVTPKQNIAHAVRRGRFTASTNPNCIRKITFEQAEEIRLMHSTSGRSTAEIARQYGIGWTTVKDIVSFHIHKRPEQFLEVQQ